jgi:hypothetical protein
MTMAKTLSAIAILTITATAALSAQTAQQQYEKLRGKYLTQQFAKPNLACICLPTRELGAMQFTPKPFPGAIPTFDTDGSVSAEASCNGDFAILPK